jgi:hypothetical protein
MAVLLPIDELNVMEASLVGQFETDPETGASRIKSKQAYEDIIDELLDLFLLAYASGVAAANDDLQTDIEVDADHVSQAVNKAVAGKTWKERVKDYYEDGATPFDISRIAETDMTRIYNTGVMDVATAADGKTRSSPGEKTKIYKRWNTMLDDRVRDTHSYLEGVRVPYNAEFFTFDGDHALGPGMFEKVSNNANCRCVLSLSRA